MKKTILFVGFALVFSMVFMNAVISPPIQSINKEEPQSAAASDFSLVSNDVLVYRTYINNSRENRQNDTYERLTIMSIMDNADNTTLTWKIEKAKHESFVWVLEGTESHEFNLSDYETWFGENYIFPKNTELDDYSTYFDSQLSIWWSDVSGISATYGPDYMNVTGTKNALPFMYYIQINVSLGYMIREITKEDSNLKVKTLIKSPDLVVPTDFGFMPGNVLKYFTPTISEMNASFTDVLIEFIYQDGLQKVVVVSYKFYLNEGGVTESKFHEWGRIEGTNIAMGSNAQHKNVNMTGSETGLSNFLISMGMTNPSVYAESKYIRFSAKQGLDDWKIEMRYPSDSSSGAFDFQVEYRNDTIRNVWILIDGPGVQQNPASYPYIAMPEGANWEVINQHISEERKPKEGGGEEWYHNDEVSYEKYQITHIFQLNGTGVVFGDIWKASSRSYTTKSKIFVPFLIHDGGANINFFGNPQEFKMKYFPPPPPCEGDACKDEGGDGPILFPSNFDGTTVSSPIRDMLLDQWDLDSFSYWEAGTNFVVGSRYDSETNFYVKISPKGLMEQLRMNFRFENETHSKRSQDVMVLLTSSEGCATPVTQTLGVGTGDELIWERSESKEPSNKQWSKKVILSLINACSGGKIILTSEFWKDNNSIDWEPRTWCLNPTWTSEGKQCSENINSWFWSTINKDDKLSWMQSDILPKEMITAGFESYKNDIVWVLKAFLTDISAEDITTDGSGFEAVILGTDGTTRTMKVRFNEEGIMQDMIMMESKPGETTKWTRNVLVSGPGATTEYFEDPENYVPTDYEDDDGGDPDFEIPGYPLLVFGIISVLSVAALIMKRKY